MRLLAAGILLVVIVSGCAPGAAPLSPAPSPVQPSPTQAAPYTTNTPTSTFTPTPSPTAAPSALPTYTASPTAAAAVCSPLEGIALEELSSPDLLKNAFQRPRPGWDEGHHGVDFAYWSRGERASMVGLPVQSILAGRVAAVLPDRQPYGNAAIIETPLDALPPAWQAFLTAALGSELQPTVVPPSLVCPPASTRFGDASGRSLYLLYAHLNQPAPLQLQQPVTCGQVIGAVGTTGNSVNAHLHLETRWGPSEAVFHAMAHYQNDASNQEMESYCAWRVSGLFTLVDPMSLLSLQP